MRAWLRNGITEISVEPRDAAILSLYYGLEPDGREWTMSEIGGLLDVSKPRIHQIRELALHRLTKHADFVDFQRTIDKELEWLRERPGRLGSLPGRLKDFLETVSDLLPSYRRGS